MYTYKCPRKIIEGVSVRIFLKTQESSRIEDRHEFGVKVSTMYLW